MARNTELNALRSDEITDTLPLTVTSTVAELNILDGVTSTAAELNILDGCTATYTELNYVDGATTGQITKSNLMPWFGAGGAKTTGNTFAATDNMEICTVDSTAADVTVKMPNNAAVAFPVGSILMVVHSAGANDCIIDGNTNSVTLKCLSDADGATALTNNTLYIRAGGCAMLIKYATDAWMVLHSGGLNTAVS